MRAPRQSGFTLIEALVALAVLGVAATMALPEFNSLLANRRVASAADDLYATLFYARSEAIRMNQAVMVAPYGNTTWSNGWQVEDPSHLGTYFIRHANQKLNVTSAAANITYYPSGRVPAGSVTTFTLCDNNSKAVQRVVTIGLDGLPVITRGGQCP